MKITFLLTQDISSPSGLGRYFPWAKEMALLGYEIQIIALHSDFDPLPVKRENISGVKIDYVAQMHVKKRGNSKTYFSPLKLLWIVLNGTIKLTLAAMQSSTDVLLIGKPHPMNSIAAFIVKIFKPKTKIILDCDDYEAESNRFQAGWQKKVVAWFENAVPRKALFVTCNTYYNIHRLEANGIPSQKLFYLPNGIDPQRFQEPDLDSVKKLRNDLDLDNKKVIAFIGSMSLTNHAVDILLRSFPDVQKAIPETRLLLVGTGEDIDILKNLAQTLGIEQNTRFVGRVPPEQIPLYYAISDITVDPVNDDEAARGRCPLKIFESWACRVPIVTADVGDRGRLIGDPPAGLLVLQGDHRSLSDGLIRLISNPEMGKMARNRGSKVISTYYWPQLVLTFISRLK